MVAGSTSYHYTGFIAGGNSANNSNASPIQSLTVWLTCRRYGKTTKPQDYFAGKVRLHTHAEGGQVEPLLGRLIG